MRFRITISHLKAKAILRPNADDQIACFDQIAASVTRLGDLLHFGQLFKARGNNYFAQSANTF